MRAVVVTRFGDPDVLALQELPDPEPGPEDVRVRVAATALNRADLLQRMGRYPAPPGAPRDVPGLEFAGAVELCGARVTGLSPGDRVMGILGGGGYAERVVLHERLCLPIPGTLDDLTAAAVPEAYLTAYDALVLQGGLQAGESVLVSAAASGVGLAALQIARACGARTVALSRSPAKRERLATLGFGPAFDPAAPDALASIRAACGEVDLVLDLVGAAQWPLHLDILAERGRMILAGTMGGARVDADLGVVLRKRLALTGTVLRARPLEEKIALTQAFARRMLPLLASGALVPQVDRVFDLADAARAHAHMQANANFGKIVLRVS